MLISMLFNCNLSNIQVYYLIVNYTVNLWHLAVNWWQSYTNFTLEIHNFQIKFILLDTGLIFNKNMYWNYNYLLLFVSIGPTCPSLQKRNKDFFFFLKNFYLLPFHNVIYSYLAKFSQNNLYQNLGSITFDLIWLKIFLYTNYLEKKKTNLQKLNFKYKTCTKFFNFKQYIYIKLYKYKFKRRLN